MRQTSANLVRQNGSIQGYKNAIKILTSVKLRSNKDVESFLFDLALANQDEKIKHDIISAINEIEVEKQPGDTSVITKLLIFFNLVNQRLIEGNSFRENDIKIIFANSTHAQRLLSILEIEDIEKLKIPEIEIQQHGIKDIVDYIEANNYTSTLPLMTIREKYYEKLSKKLDQSPQELDDDFKRYLKNYIKIEKLLTKKVLSMADQQSGYPQDYLNYERGLFMKTKVFEPLFNIKLFNKIPKEWLDESASREFDLLNKGSLINLQSLFSLPGAIDIEKEDKIEKVSKFLYRLKNKLSENQDPQSIKKSLQLFNDTVFNYEFLVELSNNDKLDTELKKTDNQNTFAEYYETKLGYLKDRFVREKTQHLSGPTLQPPPPLQPRTVAPLPKKKEVAPPQKKETTKETTIEDDTKKIFKLALSLTDSGNKEKFIKSSYNKFLSSNRSSENYLSFLESTIDQAQKGEENLELDQVGENLMPQILNIIKDKNIIKEKNIIGNYFESLQPNQPLSKFGLAILREFLKSEDLEINTEMLKIALSSESAVMFLDMALEPRKLDLLINGPQLSRASQSVGNDRKRSFLSENLALLSDKNKEELLKTLLSDDEKYKNIKTNKELIFSTLGLEFIQAFYEKSKTTPQENPEHSKLSNKEKQDLFKLLLENPNFNEERLKDFLNKFIKENPEIISEFFKTLNQSKDQSQLATKEKTFDEFPTKILKLLDPKIFFEKFFNNDSIISEQAIKSNLLLSFVDSHRSEQDKEILIDSVSKSKKLSPILVPLLENEKCQNLFFKSCKGSTFYHNFIASSSPDELDEETQSKRVSMYLSSNKNNEQKIELLILLAEHKPDLFVKKLLEDREDFKNSLSPIMFTEKLKMESFDARKKMEIFTYLAQNKSDIIDLDEETKNAFAQTFFSSPKSIKTVENELVSERSPSSPTPDKALTESPDQPQSNPEQSKEIPETTATKLKQIFNAILPSTQSITLKPHYIQPQDGPLKDFKLGFFNSNSITDSQADSSQYKNLFHQQFDTLFKKILNTYSSKNEQQQSQLKTSLYAILAISSGDIGDRNGNEIKKFLAYSDEILKLNYNQETRIGDGHGSWIGQNPIRFKKAMTILAKMDSVFDKDSSAFSESNLQRWLESQYHTPEVKIALNKDSDEYVRNILSITASNTKHEVSIRKTIKDFLGDNLAMLNTLCTDKSGNGKKLLNYSYDEFSKSELSKLSSELEKADFMEKFQDLKDNFPRKIANFKNTLNDARLLNQYIENEDGQLLLKFICQLNNHNFENILKRDVSDSEQITGINLFIRALGSPRSFHQLKDDLIKIGQGISEKIPSISPENPAQVAGQESVYSR